MIAGIVPAGGAGPVIVGIVPAGGSGRRMGGVDKAVLRVGGLTLLDRVLGALRPVCDRVVVVGPNRPTDVAGVEFVVEAEPGGGPVPAVIAGLAAAEGCDVVMVVAADLPLLTEGDLRRLLHALESSAADAACAGANRLPNPLLSAYRAGPLRAASACLGPGSPASRLLPEAVVVVNLGRATLNVNGPQDLLDAEQAVALAKAEEENRWRS